jgi:protein-L-isoaspartate(D-aspartate) O-methyltransferase
MTPGSSKRRPGFLFLFLVGAGLLGFAMAAQNSEYASERAAMVQRLRTQGIRNERVLSSMSRVPRHRFVPERFRAIAYEDEDIPVGDGVVLYRPHVIAIMAQVADPRPGARIMHVGTGPGYLTAVLAEITPGVYALDGRPGVREAAKRRLAELDYRSVRFEEGRACLGLPKEAPFDAIVCSCAAEHAPWALLSQLGEGGRLVIPIGRGPEQTLNCLRKTGGRFRAEAIPGVRIRVTPMSCNPDSP